MRQKLASVSERIPQLVKYELLEEIGHGGMATVYRARDRRLGREVAIKLIHPHLRQNPEVAARFISEAKTVAKLRHPNIVEVYDVSDSGEDERYLVVELIRGVTLRQLLSEHQRLPVEVAVGVALELALALEHAHKEGVIHRDIKPENVLVETATGGGTSAVRVMLTDFGIAKLLDAQGITSTGQVLGSPAHMAPEQIEGAAVDVRADVFGLGVLLYECLVGHLPFDGKNPAQVLRAVLEGTFIRADKERPEVGSRFALQVSKALARDVDRRFASVSDFAAALRNELSALQFDSTEGEVAQFVSSPASYLTAYPERIVERLVTAGELARKNRQVALATAHFNRALAYRPGDPQLLARVSGLARRKRFSSLLRGGVGLGALLGACALLGFQGWSLWLAAHAPTVQSTATPVRPVQAPAAAPPVVADHDAVEAERPKKPSARVNAKPVSSQARRKVEVRITGAMGGTLKIDGQPKEWFGAQHELQAGEHIFEFVPPDETCCVPETQHVLIEEGDGVQQVVGHLAFRPATLEAPSKLGLEVRCPTLFPEVLRAPGERSIPMGHASASGSCTLTIPGEGSVPVEKAVTLRAGQSTQLSWP
ncbi:MAG TPA: serine/threonine-protein kinase [Polyangiaceae bacterium]|nr:serine/threonine-protein kinase [Polyangiaceae bacterium]